MSDFNMNELDGTDAFGGARVLPESGDYNLMIAGAETETNKAGNGTNAVMSYTILDGPHQGAEVKEWLAVVNKSETAQRIARERLKAIQVVTKTEGESSIGSLVGKSLRARLMKEPNTFTDRTTGEKRHGHNINVANYMDTDNKNARGEVVPPFVQTAKAETTQNNDNTGATGGGNVGSGAKDYDDQIPF